MLRISGRPSRFCDGVSRRDFLRIGGLTLGGLTLAELLRHEAHAQSPARHKSVIMVYLPGGPPHQDTFDLKPAAPTEIRGEFKPIATNVPGVLVCEHLPLLAGMMDKLAVIRSVVGCRDEHASNQCLSGFSPIESRQQAGGRPSLGSALSKIAGPVDRTVPPFVGLAPRMGHAPWANPGDPGFLGRAHAAFSPTGEGMADMTLRHVTADRLADRTALLKSFDCLRRDLDTQGSFEAMDAFNRQALEVLSSNKLVEALDVTREDSKLRERYGVGSPANVDDGGPCWNDQFLVARRLVEAGVRCVTLAFGRWDYHFNNFSQCRERLPQLDRGVSALVEDLHQRGLDKDVAVVVWGEFGRTPRINKDGGRDHWPQVSCALLAGGGMRTGQVIGSTDRHGGTAKERPVHVQSVLATLYHHCGIDTRSQTLPDVSGRPVHLLDRGEPIRELVNA